jgi:Tol biopolymer transport system component
VKLEVSRVPRLRVLSVLFTVWIVALASTAHADTAPIALEREGDIFTYAIGSVPHPLMRTVAREHAPVWAPGHRRLAFVVWDRRVSVLDLRDGTRRRVARLPERIDRIEALAWSPDGARIALAATNEFIHEGTWHLNGSVWTVSATGEGLARILTGQGLVSGLGWTADGLLASTDWPNGVELWRPNAPLGVIGFESDGRQLRVVSQTLASHLDASDDGRRVVYRGWLKTCHACGEIWRMASDGSGAHIIAMPPDGVFGFFHPRFSPAGTRIAVASSGDRSALWIMRPDGSRLHRVLWHVDSLDW